MPLRVDDLALLAPGGAYHAPTRTLVVADLHAGYVATLQRRGYTLPSSGDEALHAALAAMLDAADVARVVVAGDLVHGRPALASARGEATALEALLDALGARALEVVPGNHDRASGDALARWGVRLVEAAEVGPHRVLHGDEDVDLLRGERALAATRGARVIVGHHHPALTLDDGAGARRRVPAFAYAAGLLCLPALTPLARGADLLRDDHAEGLTVLAPPRELELAVVVGAQVIAVGALARVRRASRASRSAG